MRNYLEIEDVLKMYYVSYYSTLYNLSIPYQIHEDSLERLQEIIEKKAHDNVYVCYVDFELKFDKIKNENLVILL